MSIKKWIIAAAAVFILFMAGIVASVYIYPPQGVLIFEYHRVNDKTVNTDDYTLSRQQFQEQLNYFKENGYNTISFMDYIRAQKYGEELPPNPIILSFDDGYADNYYNMMPMVEAMNMKATMFMATNYIGREGYVSWQQLKEMQNRGIEIGSHTANHIPLDEVPADKLDDEIKLSKLLMEWNGMKTIYFFSYPNGVYTDESIQCLKNNNYLAAVTGDAGYNEPNTDNYLLQRTNVSNYRFGSLGFKWRILKTKVLYRLGINQHIY